MKLHQILRLRILKILCIQFPYIISKLHALLIVKNNPLLNFCLPPISDCSIGVTYGLLQNRQHTVNLTALIECLTTLLEYIDLLSLEQRP